jgi:hypothetical protein
MGSQEIIKEDDFTLIRFQNDGIENFNAQRVSSGLIQFHFGLKGSAFFNQGNYALELKEKIIAFVQSKLPLNLELAEFMDFGDYFHQKIQLFSSEADYITFLSADNKDKKYYNEGNISPSMAIVLSQLFHYSLPSIYQRNLVCICNEPKKTEQQCPF